MNRSDTSPFLLWLESSFSQLGIDGEIFSKYALGILENENKENWLQEISIFIEGILPDSDKTNLANDIILKYCNPESIFIQENDYARITTSIEEIVMKEDNIGNIEKSTSLFQLEPVPPEIHTSNDIPFDIEEEKLFEADWFRLNRVALLLYITFYNYAT